MAKVIGKRIKAARLRTEFTQEDMGSYLGIGRAAYSNIENGHSLITVEHLLKLPPKLGQSVDYFLGINNNQSDIGEVIELYRVLPDRAKTHTRVFLRALANYYVDKEPVGDYETVLELVKQMSLEDRLRILFHLQQLASDQK